MRVISGHKAIGVRLSNVKTAACIFCQLSTWPEIIRYFAHTPHRCSVKTDDNRGRNCGYLQFDVYGTSNTKRHIRGEGIKTLQPKMSVLL
jgi:hypothetical protein